LVCPLWRFHPIGACLLLRLPARLQQWIGMLCGLDQSKAETLSPTSMV
jgi:hypothetical protein